MSALVFESSTLRSRIDTLRKLKVRWFFKVLRVSGLKGQGWPREKDLLMSWTSPSATVKGKTRREQLRQFDEELSFLDGQERAYGSSLVTELEEDKRKSKREAAGNIFSYTAKLQRETLTTNTTCAAAHWKVIYLTWSLKQPDEKNKFTRAVRVLATGLLSLVDCAYKHRTEIKVELSPSSRTIGQDAPVILHLAVQAQLVDNTKYAISLASTASNAALAAGSTPDPLTIDLDDSLDSSEANRGDAKKLDEAMSHFARTKQALEAVERTINDNKQQITQLQLQRKRERAVDQQTLVQRRQRIQALLPVLRDSATQLEEHDRKVVELQSQYASFEQSFRSLISQHRRAHDSPASQDHSDSGVFQLVCFVVLISAVFISRLFT